jgi:hypothetical protein
MRKNTLNTDGTPRKKYTTKKMIMAKNRKIGQKKAWDTRRALYPETNGFKPKMVEGKPKLELHTTPTEIKVDVEPEIRVNESTVEIVKSLANLDEFLNSIPGVEFDREKFIAEALSTAVATIVSGSVNAALDMEFVEEE